MFTRFKPLALSTVVGLMLGVAGEVKAELILTGPGHTTDRFATNPLSGLPDGDFVQIYASVVGTSTPDSLDSLSVVATQGEYSVSLNFASSNLYSTWIPYTGAPTGPWRITGTDSVGTSDPVFTLPITAPWLVPFVTDITVSNNSITPTVSWTLPDLAPFNDDLIHTVEIRIYDIATENQLANDILFLDFDSGTSFTVPDGILQPGGSYIYRIGLGEWLYYEDYDRFMPTNRSNAFSQVVQVVPEPGSVALVGLGSIVACVWRKRRR